jgi:hypothetical protein
MGGCDMPGPIEEGAKVATAVVEAVKNQPMTLAMILFNLLFVLLVFLGSKDFRGNQLKLMSMMIELTGKSQEMLGKCIIPQRSPVQLQTDKPEHFLRITTPK